MELAAPAIVLSVRMHGEHGAIVRALTREGGLRAGYVRGGRSTRLRPVLQPGNAIVGVWRARTDDQLAGLTVDLIESRAVLHGEPLAAAALDWLTALTATALPEAQPYPRLYNALSGVIGAIVAAPAARGWAAALVRYELLLLAELGFGLDLDRCGLTGATGELAFVSPRTGVAVSRAAAGEHAPRLLPLPRFLTGGGEAAWPDILSGLTLTGHFLARDILADRRRDALAARDRLVDRLQRAAG